MTEKMQERLDRIIELGNVIEEATAELSRLLGFNDGGGRKTATPTSSNPKPIRKEAEPKPCCGAKRGHKSDCDVAFGKDADDPEPVVK